jgi:starch synthase
MAAPLRVLIISSEAVPYAKSGGLGDAVGALAKALRARGIDVRLLLPRYGWVDPQGLIQHPGPLLVPLHHHQPHGCALMEGSIGDVPVYFLEHNVYYDRPYLYGPPGATYGDNHTRFALLSRAAISVCETLDWWPHVLHANDWQAALVSIYSNTETTPPHHNMATILTIHNLAHQGWITQDAMAEAGMNSSQAHQLGLVSNNSVNILQGGINHSTLLTTVSPTYAEEIQTAAYGEGLDNVLRSRRDDLFGVLNGIDQTIWNPQNDPHLPRGFSADDLSGKAYCKAALQKEAGLALRPDVPLIGMVTRLAAQKGVDLLLAGLDRLLKQDLQLVLLGTGDPTIERALAQRAQASDKLQAWITFDERRAHLIEAGADLFLMPSRWEPCGLNQMYSQRYGTLPIVRGTGGLRDTVANFDAKSGEGTGFVFYDATPNALHDVVLWAIDTYANNRTAFKGMVRRAMDIDHGWARSAATYEYFYRLSVVRRHGG